MSKYIVTIRIQIPSDHTGKSFKMPHLAAYERKPFTFSEPIFEFETIREVQKFVRDYNNAYVKEGDKYTIYDPSVITAKRVNAGDLCIPLIVHAPNNVVLRYYVTK